MSKEEREALLTAVIDMAAERDAKISHIEVPYHIFNDMIFELETRGVAFERNSTGEGIVEIAFNGVPVKPPHTVVFPRGESWAVGIQEKA
jgi:hypothetical protein